MKAPLLTTEKIIKSIETGRYWSWLWEEAIETTTGLTEEDTRDAISAMKFLEQWQPGGSWSASEFRRLMSHHFTSRWPSAAEIGVIRAHEEHEEGRIGDQDLARITESDAASEKYLRDIAACHVFTDEDGSVLTFDGLWSPDDLKRTDE